MSCTVRRPVDKEKALALKPRRPARAPFLDRRQLLCPVPLAAGPTGGDDDDATRGSGLRGDDARRQARGGPVQCTQPPACGFMSGSLAARAPPAPLAPNVRDGRSRSIRTPAAGRRVARRRQNARAGARGMAVGRHLDRVRAGRCESRRQSRST